MADNVNWGRSYRLSAGLAGKTGFEIGGEDVPLHINFSCQKSDSQTQNTGKVEVWNLSPEHLAVLAKSKCILSLRAGYGDRMSLIFAGTVSYASTTLDGADRKTEIEVVDNLIEVKDTYVSVAYSGKVNWKTILDDVANQMGVAVNYSYNAAFADIANGYSFVGKGKDVVTKGCNCCGLTWSLQNGVMQVKKPRDTMSRNVYLLNKSTGLVGIPARVIVTQDDTAGTKQMGWDVEYFMNGAINVDDYVKLETSTVTGYFRVYSLTLEGDNTTGDWTCEARLLEVK